MSKKYIAGIIMAGLFFVPSFSMAQSPTREDLARQINALLQMIQSLQAQLAVRTGGGGGGTIQTPQPTPTKQCTVTFNSNLAFGISEFAEVTKLQRFLTNEGFYDEENIIGIFGSKTKEAVKKWQIGNGVITANTTEEAGAGSVGPKTRAAINAKCDIVPVIPTGPTPLPVVTPIVVPLPSVPPAVVATTTPSIIITSPIAGSVWEVGSRQNIYWNWNGGDPSDFRIKLIAQFGNKSITNITNSVRGSKLFTGVPNVINGNYRIEICENSLSNGKIICKQSGVISIKPPETASTPPTTITTFSPVQGTVLSSKQTFSWNKVKGATEYYLYVGNNSRGTNGIASIRIGGQAETRATVSIKQNGKAVFARVWYMVSGVWKSQDFGPFTAGVETVTPIVVVTPKVTNITSKGLSIQYDSNRRESSLVAEFEVTVESEGKEVVLPTNAFSTGVRSVNNVRDGRPSIFHLNTIHKKIGGGGGGSLDGSVVTKISTTFLVTGTINPKAMFAGRYNAIITGINLNGTWTDLSNFIGNTTNFATLVGETTPYITSISPSSLTQGQSFRINGERFMNSDVDSVTVVIDNSIRVRADQTENMAYVIPSSLPNKLSLRRHLLRVEGISKITGAIVKSNTVAFDVVGVTEISTASITVTSPNGGEVWEKGTKQIIKWTGGSGKTDIYLYRNTPDASCGFCNYTSVLASGIPVTKEQYAWVIPSTLISGNTFHVRLSGGSTADNSNASFSIVAPVVSTAPKVTNITSGELSIRYDASSHEAELYSTLTLTISSGSKELILNKNAISVVAFNNTGIQDGRKREFRTTSISADSISGAVSGTSFDYKFLANNDILIPPNRTFTLSLGAFFNPKTMFAGRYNVIIQSIKLNGIWTDLRKFAGNGTNFVTLVGETSPYITVVTSPIVADQDLVINGERLLSGANDKVVISSRNVKGLLSIRVRGRLSGDSSSSVVVQASEIESLPSGFYWLHIQNVDYSNMIIKSNTVAFEIVKSVAVGAVKLDREQQLANVSDSLSGVLSRLQNMLGDLNR